MCALVSKLFKNLLNTEVGSNGHCLFIAFEFFHGAVDSVEVASIFTDDFDVRGGDGAD